jgi:transposase
MDSQIPFPAEIWERIPPEAQAYIRVLESRVASLEATVQQLREQVQQTSRTSSRPVERSATGDPKRPRREPSGPPGQPGMRGSTALLPVEGGRVSWLPERCHPPAPVAGDPQPQRHQVTEIPPMKPVVTEYQLHRLVCPACGEETRAEVPGGVPTGGFGPRVQAITALCTGAYHLSKRTTQRALEDLFGVQMGLGTIANLEHATVQAVAEPVAEARAYVQQQPTAYLDETGWREGQQRAWLWTAVTEWVTVFVIRASRGGKVAQELLGERFWGWLVTDRWSAYTWYPPWRRQVCWRICRDIEAMMIARWIPEIEALRAQARRCSMVASSPGRHVDHASFRL